MTKRILIESGAGETRAALLDGDRVAQYQVQPSWRAEVVGSIYRAVVRNVNRSLEAAFLDLGLGKDAFLNAREFPGLYEGKGRRQLHDVLKPGQSVLVQVAREAIGGKGATVTGYVSLPGRYLVLVPENERSGISRKLSDKERERLRRILDKVELPKGLGVIVRTAGADKTRTELEKDLGYLLRLWADIETAYNSGRDARLLYREGSLPVRFVREFFNTEVKEIRVNDARTHRELQTFVKVFAPRKSKAVVLEEQPGLFRRSGVESQVEQLSQRRVRLPSGGQLVIDPTEALTAIDVNSARTKGKDADSTLYKTNLEAATEVARQVILRDIGGLIVIDFIDMDSDAQRKEVESEIKKAFASDKARVHLGRISEFGLFELSRQRLRPELRKVTLEICAHCDGAGYVKTPARATEDLLVRISSLLARPGNGGVRVEACPDEARHLLNARRRELLAFEDATGKIVDVRAHPDAQAGNARLTELPIVASTPDPEPDEFAVLTMYSAIDVEGLRLGRPQPEPTIEPEADDANEADDLADGEAPDLDDRADTEPTTTAPDRDDDDDDDAMEPEDAAEPSEAQGSPAADRDAEGRRKRGRRSRRGGRGRSKRAAQDGALPDSGPEAPEQRMPAPVPAAGTSPQPVVTASVPEPDEGPDDEGPDDEGPAGDAAPGEPSGDRKRRTRRRRKRSRSKGGTGGTAAGPMDAASEPGQSDAPKAAPVRDTSHDEPQPRVAAHDTPPPSDGPLDERVNQVAARFAPKGRRPRAATPAAARAATPTPDAPAPQPVEKALAPAQAEAAPAKAPDAATVADDASAPKRGKKGWLKRILDAGKEDEPK